MSSETKDKIGNLLDVLYIELMHLVEEQVLAQIHRDVNQSRALLMLAKIRLQQGNQCIAAAAQLPCSRPYKSLIRLVQEVMPWGMAWKLLRHQIEPLGGYVQPLGNMFGSLVSCGLHVATQKWMACVDQLLNVVNVNGELRATLNSIQKLKWIIGKKKKTKTKT
ncbi:LOW QUALITY PROTEIN: uncharacterized protein [Drosophila tropicalis]|uniref:LOW QUALITY PROTEIN: uncharacterized protein n=1 Tax=Drosophila tropicalis TaxID=46794 RepID=UPI0035AB95F8